MITVDQMLVKKAKLLFGELFVIEGPVDHYEDNINLIVKALSEERKKAILEFQPTVDAFVKYGDHLKKCPRFFSLKTKSECTCGLEEALKIWNSIQGKP